MMDGRVKIEIDRWRTFSKLWQMICAGGVPNDAATRITNLPELIVQMKQNKTKIAKRSFNSITLYPENAWSKDVSLKRTALKRKIIM